jgi:MFS superfamily sulfate permease-like transporter
VLILLLKRWPRIPGILIAVIAATAWSRCSISATACPCSVSCREGLPRRAPAHSLDDLVPVLTGGSRWRSSSFADTSVLSRTYAARMRTPVDPNQEMVGLGTRTCGRLLPGLSHQQQLVAHAGRRGRGRETQLTGVVGAHRDRTAAASRPNLLEHLPNTALAAVVIARRSA